MARTVTVTTEHGVFTRQTENDYSVIAVGLWSDGVTIGTTWHRSLGLARRAPSFARVLGFYSVATGKKLAPGLTIGPSSRRAPKVAKPVVVHQFERCSECELRHDPARLRCGNCWRCHEPSVPCKITRAEVQASIERHNAEPTIYRVLTRTWRSFEELKTPQCACHRPTR